MYDTTASLYDRTAAFEQPEAVRDLIQERLAQQGIQPPALLGDLGSGTGIMSILFAQAGWQVEGVELSAAMIEVARQKAALLSLEIRQKLHWTQGDITCFELPESRRWNAAVSLCNTINHLSLPGQIQAFTQSTFNALKPGGILILDSDTLQTFQQFFNHPPILVWEGEQYGEAHRFWRVCEFDEKTHIASHSAFIERQTGHGWERISEEAMRLKYHPEPELLACFEQTGFQVLNAEPFNPFPDLYVNILPKLLWTLQKPN